MPAEVEKEIQLEIAHVLFIDIVGYSKLSINEQHAAVEELNQVVWVKFARESSARALEPQSEAARNPKARRRGFSKL
jgi:hypothetical protein